MTVLLTDITVIERSGLLYKTPVSDFFYRKHVSTLVPVGLTSSSPTSYLVLNESLPSTNDYKVSWSLVWSFDDSANDIVIEVDVSGTLIAEYRIEPSDSLGNGTTVTRFDTPGTVNTGTNQRLSLCGFHVMNMTAGQKQIRIRVSSTDNSAAVMYSGSLIIERF